MAPPTTVGGGLGECDMIDTTQGVLRVVFACIGHYMDSFSRSQLMVSLTDIINDILNLLFGDFGIGSTAAAAAASDDYLLMKLLKQSLQSA